MVVNFTTMQALLVILIAAGLPPADSEPDQLARPGCRSRCGSVDIPYPFGTTDKCSLNTKFRVKCQNGRPVLGQSITIKSISLQRHEMTILGLVAEDCYAANGSRTSFIRYRLKLSTLTISNTKNKFAVIGCDSYAFLGGQKLNGKNFSMGCMSVCKSRDDVSSDGTCSGIGCCQIDIPEGLKDVRIRAHSFNNHTNLTAFNPCSYAFVVEESRFRFSREFLGNLSGQRLPLVVDWAVNNDMCEKSSGHRNTSFCSCGRENTARVTTPDRLRYNCICKPGYQGNPYLPQGCPTDIDECKNAALNNCTKDQYCENTAGGYICKARRRQLPLIQITIGSAIGFVALIIGGSWLHLVYKKRKLIQLKEKFFRQNGGLILKQRLSREDNATSEAAKIFTEEELKRATLNYDDSTIIGRGGFGTVYKGCLPDNRTVAIKKSKLVDQNQTEQFINEVVVLSQINHRNVVKLLGCCLETQVPLLVYEYVPNGNLSEHIHNKDKSSNLVWETRLKIAAQTAEALSYLHSAASTPIIHRDVKPSNILLDNYTAKVSDFGASKLVPLDQTEFATMVQGTLGYLDPEYLHTNQLTEKSDVYSFGVVLVELLTGKKAISFERPEEERSLAMHFLSSFKSDGLFEIVEIDIVSDEQGNREQVEEVARLAIRCLSVKGEERPTMKEVAMELEELRKMEKHPWANKELINLEETEYLLADQRSVPYQDAETTNANSAYDSLRDHVLLDFTGR